VLIDEHEPALVIDGKGPPRFFRRPVRAALSGSQSKASGSAGGYLLTAISAYCFPNSVSPLESKLHVPETLGAVFNHGR
jgi:hypothetical protein